MIVHFVFQNAGQDSLIIFTPTLYLQIGGTPPFNAELADKGFATEIGALDENKKACPSPTPLHPW